MNKLQLLRNFIEWKFNDFCTETFFPDLYEYFTSFFG